MANPFFDDDPEEQKTYQKMIISCIIGCSFVVLLFLIVLYANTSKKKKPIDERPQKQQEEEEEFEYGQSNLVSSDLDFWDMFDEDEIATLSEDDESNTTSFKEGTKNKKKSDKDSDKKSGEESDNNNDSNKEADKDFGSSNENDNDDDHLAVTDAEGKVMYYEILENAKKNDYNFQADLTKDDNGKIFYKSGDKASKAGISLDKNSGDIDFAKVKNSGVDFCMLRIGLRGYSTGAINLDERFIDYATNARNNNLYLGIYFDSSAVTEAEAIEEASFAVGAIGNYGIRFPVAINLDQDGFDSSSRNAKLTMKERTDIVKAFCDTVKQYNYNPVIRAKRDTMISKLNIEELKSYDVWISDYNYPTDYPYEFTIWDYSKDIKVDGINVNVPVNISFIDYSEK